MDDKKFIEAYTCAENCQNRRSFDKAIAKMVQFFASHRS